MCCLDHRSGEPVCASGPQQNSTETMLAETSELLFLVQSWSTHNNSSRRRSSMTKMALATDIPTQERSTPLGPA